MKEVPELLKEIVKVKISELTCRYCGGPLNYQGSYWNDQINKFKHNAECVNECSKYSNKITYFSFSELSEVDHKQDGINLLNFKGFKGGIKK